MSRGGFRPGAGNKPIDPEKLRVQVTVTVAPETKAKLDRMRASGLKIGRIIDSLVAGYCEDSEE